MRLKTIFALLVVYTVYYEVVSPVLLRLLLHTSPTADRTGSSLPTSLRGDVRWPLR
ncbi:hypothetical protein [Nonomuraea sp. B19D2]|uniref:hypothetical protein n=1 Tax=Nonomuraea sp. B19D2 TaxID=3159561 RepID=UPI0032DA6510